MTKTLLSESTSAPVKAGTGRWKSVLITPGQGSSGNYSESVLREHGPKVLRKGAKSFVTHNRTENGEPDPFAMWGFLAEDSYYEDGVGLVGTIEVLPSWRERVEEVAPHTALSVYLMGELDESGNVTSFVEDVQNGVDLVAYPGRPGSALVEQMIESAKAQSEDKSPGARQAEKKEIQKMDEELKAALTGISEALALLVAEKKNETAAEAQVEADKAAVTSAVEAYAGSVKAIQEADLLEPQRDELLEAAKSGADITARIESAKAVKAAAVEAVRVGESAGRDFGTKTETKYGAWK